MDKNTKHRIVIVLLVIFILFSGFLYNQSLKHKRELGIMYYNSLGHMVFHLNEAIESFKNDRELSIIECDIDKLYLIDGFLSSSKNTTIRFSRFFNPLIDFKKLENDEEYKEKILTKLTNYNNVLKSILDDIDKSKEDHRITKIRKWEWMFTSKESISDALGLSDGIIYYDYFSQEPENKKFKNKIHEFISSEMENQDILK